MDKEIKKEEIKNNEPKKEEDLKKEISIDNLDNVSGGVRIPFNPLRRNR